MARVHLRLLGSLEVTTPDGTTVEFPTRKSAALLDVLAPCPGRGVQRARPAAMLWGESGERQARANLRQALRLLRRALPLACIRSEGDCLALDPGGVEVDLQRFEALAAERGEPALEQAVELYGGALLDGIGLAEPLFRDWLESERAWLSERAVAVMLDPLHPARGGGRRRAGHRRGAAAAAGARPAPRGRAPRPDAPAPERRQPGAGADAMPRLPRGA